MDARTTIIEISLRKATIADLRLLEEWDKEDHVIESDPNDDWQWEVELNRNPGWREQLIAEVAGDPIGFIQIIDPMLEESHYWGHIGSGFRAIDIWIGKKENLGRGFGTSMMTSAIQRCFSDERVHTIIIDPLSSNTKARHFYEKMGFGFVKYQRFGEDDCAVYQLHRDGWVKHKK